MALEDITGKAYGKKGRFSSATKTAATGLAFAAMGLGLFGGPNTAQAQSAPQPADTSRTVQVDFTGNGSGTPSERATGNAYRTIEDITGNGTQSAKQTLNNLSQDIVQRDTTRTDTTLTSTNSGTNTFTFQVPGDSNNYTIESVTPDSATVDITGDNLNIEDYGVALTNPIFESSEGQAALKAFQDSVATTSPIQDGVTYQQNVAERPPARELPFEVSMEKITMDEYDSRFDDRFALSHQHVEIAEDDDDGLLYAIKVQFPDSTVMEGIAVEPSSYERDAQQRAITYANIVHDNFGAFSLLSDEKKEYMNDRFERGAIAQTAFAQVQNQLMEGEESVSLTLPFNTNNTYAVFKGDHPVDVVYDGTTMSEEGSYERHPGVINKASFYQNNPEMASALPFSIQDSTGVPAPSIFMNSTESNGQVGTEPVLAFLPTIQYSTDISRQEQQELRNQLAEIRAVNDSLKAASNYTTANLEMPERVTVQPATEANQAFQAEISGTNGGAIGSITYHLNDNNSLTMRLGARSSSTQDIESSEIEQLPVATPLPEFNTTLPPGTYVLNRKKEYETTNSTVVGLQYGRTFTDIVGLRGGVDVVRSTTTSSTSNRTVYALDQSNLVPGEGLIPQNTPYVTDDGSSVRLQAEFTAAANVRLFNTPIGTVTTTIGGSHNPTTSNSSWEAGMGIILDNNPVTTLYDKLRN